MKLLLPVDGSTLSVGAVRHVLKLRSEGLQFSLVLANVQEPAHLYELLMVHDTDAIDRLSAEAGLHALQESRSLLDEAGIDYELEVAKGDPAHTLVEMAERFGCDMIVMGARGTSKMRSAMLGSVSHEVLHGSSMPVMIVKDQDDVDADDPETA